MEEDSPVIKTVGKIDNLKIEKTPDGLYAELSVCLSNPSEIQCDILHEIMVNDKSTILEIYSSLGIDIREYSRCATKGSVGNSEALWRLQTGF